MTSTAIHGRWRPAGDESGHPLAPIDGAEVGNGVTLRLELGPKNKVGSDYFRAFLASDRLGATVEPVLQGLQNRGPFPGYNWVEVTDFHGRLPMPSGEEVQVPAGIDEAIIRALARIVPPGGHLMVEYDSDHRLLTARALAARVPPAATPLGGMMFSAGCVAFTDWYISEGGREGPRKLQGFMALDLAHQQRRGHQMLDDLERFMDRARDLEWDIQAATRPIAERVITMLRQRLDLPDGPLPRQEA